MVTVRLMEPSERPAVEAFARGHSKLGVEFVHLWGRWHNWDPHPPVIAVTEGGAIVGLRSWTMSRKTGYVHGYYNMVSKDFRRQGIGTMLMDASFKIIHAAGMKRMKAHTKHTSNGRSFFESLGVRAVGRDVMQVWFDFDIEPVDSVESLREWMKTPHLHKPVPKEVMVKYITQGMTPIDNMARRYAVKAAGSAA